MKFRTSLSFNGVDTRVSRVDGRLVIECGVYRRCRAIIKLMRDRNLRGISDMRDSLDNRYAYRDLYAAAKKLRAVGILQHNGYGRWVMVLRGEKIWNEVCPAQYRIRNVA